jgi:hypothetical protein
MSAAQRRGAAILCTDMVGSSVLAQKHDVRSLALLQEQRHLRYDAARYKVSPSLAVATDERLHGLSRRRLPWRRGPHEGKLRHLRTRIDRSSRIPIHDYMGGEEK